MIVLGLSRDGIGIVERLCRDNITIHELPRDFSRDYIVIRFP